MIAVAAPLLLTACYAGPDESPAKAESPKAEPITVEVPAVAPTLLDKDRKPHDIDLKGYVTDAANILSADQEQQLVDIAKNFEANPGDQLFFVTVPTLGGEDIDSYSLRNARRWPIGNNSDRDDAIVIMLAPEDRKVRIEISRGLEWTLTNALCKDIIDRIMLPRFRTKDYASGMAAGAQVLLVKRRSDAQGRQRKLRSNGESGSN